MRKSIHFFPSLREGKLLSNTEVHMFREDIANGVMPIGGRSRNFPDFKIEITGSGEEICRDLLGSISHYSNHHNDEALVSDAFRSISMSLTLNGRATFEIIHENDNNLRLANFISLRLIKMPYFYVQLVPAKDQDQYGSKLNFIKTSNVWELNIPQKLGGRLRYSLMTYQLSRIKSFISPDWVQDLYTEKINFNVKEYDKRKYKSIYKLTDAWGWNGRNGGTEYKTEFYKLLRDIRFGWALSILRKHMLNEINSFLEQRSVDAHIDITGLPLPSDFIQAKKDLQSQTLDFSEVSALTYI